MNIENYSIRPATEDDIVKILEIESKAHLAPWTETHFKEELEKPYSHFLVMTDDETDEIIAGYIVFWIMGSGGDGACEILNVAVDFPFRGKGMAKKLVQTAVASAVKEGAKRMVLDVRKSNMPAIQLYQTLKFTITQVRRSFYSNGEDAYGMTLYLDESSPELVPGFEL